MSRDAEGRTVVDVTLADSVAEYSKYSGWPELKESFMAGKVQAAYLLAPMVMDLVESGVPAKIVSLGHRSGAVIMVRDRLTGEDHPGPEGAADRDPEPVRRRPPVRAPDAQGARDDAPATSSWWRWPPPEMPAALYADQVDAYATGEPFGAVAEVAGYARILYMTRDKWPSYVCCVLTVRQELIDQERPLVQQIVNHVMSAGAWLEAAQANRDIAAEIAAGPTVFNQQPEVLGTC